jgi:hypothetical protein
VETPAVGDILTGEPTQTARKYRKVKGRKQKEKREEREARNTCYLLIWLLG